MSKLSNATAARARRKFAERRRVLPGFPLEFKFTTPEQVQEYFGAGKIQCLRCGKKYKQLGQHLVLIHEVSPDDYRALYGLPWTYGLGCAESREKYAFNARAAQAAGVLAAPGKFLAEAQAAKRKPVAPYRQVLVARNYAKPSFKKAPEGPPKPPPAKRGSAEFKAKMRARPQCQPDGPAIQAFTAYWTGREQTDEHVFNRTGSPKKRNKK